MRPFAPRVEVVSLAGEHVLYVHAELARALVESGAAEILNHNGRVRAIKLVETPAMYAERIGEPTGAALLGTRFARRVRSPDRALVWWEHHPRCADYAQGG